MTPIWNLFFILFLLIVFIFYLTRWDYVGIIYSFVPISLFFLIGLPFSWFPWSNPTSIFLPPRVLIYIWQANYLAKGWFWFLHTIILYVKVLYLFVTFIRSTYSSSSVGCSIKHFRPLNILSRFIRGILPDIWRIQAEETEE